MQKKVITDLMSGKIKKAENELAKALIKMQSFISKVEVSSKEATDALSKLSRFGVPVDINSFKYCECCKDVIAFSLNNICLACLKEFSDNYSLLPDEVSSFKELTHNKINTDNRTFEFQKALVNFKKEEFQTFKTIKNIQCEGEINEK